MALVSGFYECSEMKFLFAPRKGADCMKKKLCQATRMKDFGHKRTLCLVNTITVMNSADSIDAYLNSLQVTGKIITHKVLNFLNFSYNVRKINRMTCTMDWNS